MSNLRNEEAGNSHILIKFEVEKLIIVINRSGFKRIVKKSLYRWKISSFFTDNEIFPT